MSAEHTILLVSNLEMVHNLLKGGSDVLLCLRVYYIAPDCHAGLQQMLLLPHSIYVKGNETNQSGYLTCNECNSSIQSKRLLLFAIANGNTIGEAPPCLSSLNPVELALISKARVDKHVFQFYGGAHQSIRGWHTLYSSDVNQLSAVMN